MSSVISGDANVSATEFGYLDGVTAALQTQLDGKAPSASPTFTGTVALPSTTTLGGSTLTSGKILQVVTGSHATEVTVSSTTYADTGLSATITPTSATSDILIMVWQNYLIERSGNDAGFGLKIFRASTEIFAPDPTRRESGGIYVSGAAGVALRGRAPLSCLDSPATTSATTYKTQGAAYASNSGGYVKFQEGTATSRIALFEVSA